MSGVNISPDYISTMNLSDSAGNVNATKEGGLVCIYYLGSLFGALGGGALSDRIGRNYALIVAGFWGLLGQSLQAGAQNANWMLCARLLAGVGTGGIATIIPVWSSELVAHDARGTWA